VGGVEPPGSVASVAYRGEHPAMAGASRMVNTIPGVCEAQPGLLSALDLPRVTGAGLVRSVPGPSPNSRLF
jgi:4-hydroxy-tetrahydrodipicolinate reductase